MRVDAKLEGDAIRWLVADNPGHIQPFHTSFRNNDGCGKPKRFASACLVKFRIAFYPSFKKQKSDARQVVCVRTERPPDRSGTARQNQESKDSHPPAARPWRARCVQASGPPRSV